MYNNIAIQLWSTQEDVSKGLLDVIKRMKDAGANGVELYAIPDIPSQELAATLKEMGMQIASSHLGFDALTKNLDSTLEYFKPLGTKTLVCPGYIPVTKRSLSGLPKSSPPPHARRRSRASSFSTTTIQTSLPRYSTVSPIG